MLQNTIQIVKGWERSLDRNRKIVPVKTIGGSYEPQVSVKNDDYIDYCNHVKSSIEDVIILPDNSELLKVCEVCDKQLIGGEWL